MANSRPKRKVKKNGKTRINLRLPAELDAWVRTYVQDKHTNLTAIIINCLNELRTKTEAESVQQF